MAKPKVFFDRPSVKRERLSPRSRVGLQEGREPFPTLEARVASRYLEARSINEWLQWVAQPFAVLWKHHEAFLMGPFDDAMDAVIKELAPQLVRELAKAAVRADVEASGHPTGDALRVVIRHAVRRFRGKVTEEVVIHAAKTVLSELNPVNVLKQILHAVRQHGWKIGLGFALAEITEWTFWGVVSYFAQNPKLLAFAALPIAETAMAIALKLLGRAPKELDEANEAGHLEWYEQQFGPVRLAALRG